jgi:hypothetical protein
MYSYNINMPLCVCVCVCVNPLFSNFWMPKPIFMKIGTYIMAYVPVSKA